MATLNIPGYFYDEEKKKYFKIEKNSTAPSSAAWSADNVKKRRLEDEEAARAVRRMTLDKRRVARAKVLQHSLMGGFLDRELFGGGGHHHPRLLGKVTSAAAAFADGLADRGMLPLKDARWSSSSNVRHMYVDGQDRNTDLCVAFATTDERSVISSYVPRDQRGYVHRRLLAHYKTPGARVAPYHELDIPQISDIKFHQPSNQVLITSRSPGQDVVMWTFSPKVAETEDTTNTRPRWLLGQGTYNSTYRRINTRGDPQHTDHQANAVVPGPSANSHDICAIGTNRGVVRWVADGSYRTWLTPQQRPSSPSSSSTYSSSSSFSSPKELHNPYTDVFALDYQRGRDSGDVLFFGGRPGKLYVADYRLRPGTWDVVVPARAPSPITHVRSVNEWQVLVAGLRDRLALFDLRFLGGRSSSPSSSSSGAASSTLAVSNNSNHNKNKNKENRNKSSSSSARNFNNSGSGGGSGGSTAALPLLTFPQYRNRAHVDIGLDIDLASGSGSGIAAAAHDDGTVALYSLRTGNRLRAPDVDRVRSARGPIQALQFGAFPRDEIPSLFVGVQSNVLVCSFGVRRGEEEDG